jgi:hypothetical protein
MSGSVESFEVDGREVYARACKLRLEGVVSRVRDGRYISGRNRDWTIASTRCPPLICARDSTLATEAANRHRCCMRSLKFALCVSIWETPNGESYFP